MNDVDDTDLWQFPMPLLATAGDPAGIGAEVVHKAIRRLQREGELLDERPVAVIGDAFLFARHLPKPQEMQTYHIVSIDDFVADPGFMLHPIEPEPGKLWRPVFLDCGFKDENAVKLGKRSRIAGERASTYLGAAIELLDDEIADAVATGPICKEAMSPKDFPYPGQTEMFAEVCGVKQPVMMLIGGGLRVALATIHAALADVPALLTRKRLRAVLEVVHDSMILDFGVAGPRIAVCGLNPHAGESGRFGEEDRRVIKPVVKSLKDRGWQIEGPLAADSVFAHAKAGRYDAVVAMYHDQGLIPVKTVAFFEGVNVTLGLPIVRTSPDHGTAFDIAGRGEADEGAMYAALKLANEMSIHRAEAYADAS